MNKLVEYIDVAVIGAGHAGCEASLAAARLGLETMVFTVSVDSIAMMPCNPNIGPLENRIPALPLSADIKSWVVKSSPSVLTPMHRRKSGMTLTGLRRC